MSKLAYFCSEDRAEVTFLKVFASLFFRKILGVPFVLLLRLSTSDPEVRMVVWANLGRVLAIKLELLDNVPPLFLRKLIGHENGGVGTRFGAETHIIGVSHIIGVGLGWGRVISGETFYESTVELVTHLSFNSTFFHVRVIKNLPVLCIFGLYNLVYFSLVYCIIFFSYK